LNRRPLFVIGQVQALAGLFQHALLKLRGVEISSRPAIAAQASRSARTTISGLAGGRPARSAIVVILGLQAGAEQAQHGDRT